MIVSVVRLWHWRSHKWKWTGKDVEDR